jgi:predicted enzyme related to lactoylglutathione lyase
MKLWFNLICQDIEAQQQFYQALLQLPEAAGTRSPIYRAVETEHFQLGFNAPAAYALLGLDDRAPAHGQNQQHGTVTGYATFMLDSPQAVSAASHHACAMGGRIVKAPYATYYGQWQAVLADPENNVFRLSAIGLPAGSSATKP